MTADSTDIAKKEQLDICLQWVDQNLEFHEDLFYPHPLPNTKADTINKFILDLIKKMDLNIKTQDIILMMEDHQGQCKTESCT